MKNVIISGAAGFIGNAVTRQLIEQGVSVVAVVKPDTVKSKDAFRLNGLNIPVIECDLKETERLPELIPEHNYDAFYQFAWDGLNREALLDYKTQVDNITWILKSIEAASELNCRKYIGAGSYTQMELFYQRGRFFTDDRHKFYRVAQMACETMGRAVAKEKGIQFIWIDFQHVEQLQCIIRIRIKRKMNSDKIGMQPSVLAALLPLGNFVVNGFCHTFKMLICADKAGQKNM